MIVTLRKNNKYLASLVMISYLVILIAVILKHEIWYEEATGWLIALNSNSISELYKNLFYEAHPMLWYLILFGLTRITTNPVFMQLAHALIAALAAGVFLFFAPFKLIYRILFIFGYFPIFEYAIISRNYGLAVLFLFFYCALYYHRKEKTFWMVLILVLLANTSLLAAVIALILGFTLFIELFQSNIKLNIQLTFILILFLVGVSSGVYKSMIPHDSTLRLDRVARFDLQRLGMTLLSVERGYFPLPKFKKQFWNTNLLMPEVSLKKDNLYDLIKGFYLRVIVMSGISTILLVYGLLIFSINRIIFVIYTLSTAGLLSITYFAYYGAVRHFGFLLMIFVCCLWLTRYYTYQFKFKYLNNVRKISLKYLPLVVGMILIINVLAGVYALWMDYNYNFSTRKEAANFILKKFPDYEINGDYDTTMVSLALYLKKEIYFPRSSRKGSFVIMDSSRKDISEEDLLKSVRRKVYESQQAELLALSFPIKQNNCNINIIKKFDGSLSYNDDLFLYVVIPKCKDVAAVNLNNL